MEVLLRGSAIHSFINKTPLLGFQVSGQDSDYRLHLQTPDGEFTIQPIESLSTIERQNLEDQLREKLSRQYGK